MDVGKIDWVIRDFLASGAFVLLAAEMGSGKSTLIYRAAEAIFKGSLFLDQLQTKKGKVLVIQGDEPPADAIKKFRRMGLETQFEICYANPPLDVNWLEKQIKSKVYIAILIDSITSLFATNEIDVKDLGFPRKLYRIGKAFAEANVGGLISCHLNKPHENIPSMKQSNEKCPLVSKPKIALLLFWLSVTFLSPTLVLIKFIFILFK